MNKRQRKKLAIDSKYSLRRWDKKSSKFLQKRRRYHRARGDTHFHIAGVKYEV